MSRALSIILFAGILFTCFSANALASDILSGPKAFYSFQFSLLLIIWPIFVALVILEIVIAILIINLAQRGRDDKIPAIVKTAFILTVLSFSLGPLTGIPGLIYAHAVKRKHKGIQRQGLLTASFILGYLFLSQFLLGAISSFFISPEEWRIHM